MTEIYHEFYGSMDEHWASVCKPYADRLRELTGDRGYFAVVDDERGTFVVVADKEFHAKSLAKAFQDAWPEAERYAAYLNSGGTAVGWLEDRP